MTILWTSNLQAPNSSVLIGGLEYKQGVSSLEIECDQPMENGLMRSQINMTVQMFLGQVPHYWNLTRNVGSFVLGSPVVISVQGHPFFNGRIYRFTGISHEPDSISFRAVDALWFYDNPRPAGSYIYEQSTSVLGSPQNFQPGTYRVETGGAPLNVRSTANLNAAVVATIPNGNNVFVDEVNGSGWARLSNGGWVQAIWLAAPNQNSPLTNMTNGYGVVNGRFNTGVTVKQAITNILKWAGWDGTLQGGDELNTVKIWNPINKDENTGLVSHAGRLAWEYGYYLVQLPDGSIHLRRFITEDTSVHVYTCQNASIEPDYDYEITDTDVNVEATGYRLQRVHENTDTESEIDQEDDFDISEIIDDAVTQEILGRITTRLRWLGNSQNKRRSEKVREEWKLKGVMNPDEMLPGTQPDVKVTKQIDALDIYRDGYLKMQTMVTVGSGAFLQNQQNARDWITSWNGSRTNPSYQTLLTHNIVIAQSYTIYRFGNESITSDLNLIPFGEDSMLPGSVTVVKGMNYSIDLIDINFAPVTESGLVREKETLEAVNLLDAGNIIYNPDDNGVMGLPAIPVVVKAFRRSIYGRNRRSGLWEHYELSIDFDYSQTIISSSGNIEYQVSARRTTKRHPPSDSPVQASTAPGFDDDTNTIPLELAPYSFFVTAKTTATSPNPAGQTRYLRAEYLSTEIAAQYYADMMAAIISGLLFRIRVEVPFNPLLRPWHRYRIEGRYGGDYWCVALSHYCGTDKMTTRLVLIKATPVPYPSHSDQAPMFSPGVG